MIAQPAYSLVYKIHSWCGLVLSSLMLVTCVSGMIALFHDELQLWEQPLYRTIDLRQQRPLDENVEQVLKQYVLDDDRGIHIRLPSDNKRSLSFEIPVTDRPEKISLHINPVNGEQIPTSRYQLADFFLQLHKQLLLPQPGGTYLVGVFGFAMMILIASGVLLHRNFFGAFLTFRYSKSLRLLIADTHKLFGLWALLFHIMIVVTGATIGLSHAIEFFTVKAAMQTTTVNKQHSLKDKGRPLSGQPATMASLNQILNIARVHQPSARPYSLVLRGWGFNNATVTVRSYLPAELSRYAELEYDATSTRLVSKFVHSEDAGYFTRIFEAMVTLHFGAYGGLWVKFLYFFLSLSTIAMLASGVLLWIKNKQSIYQNRSMIRICRLMLGLQLGFIFSLVITLAIHKIEGIIFDISQNYWSYSGLFLVSWAILILVSLTSKEFENLWFKWLRQISLLLLLTAIVSLLSIQNMSKVFQSSANWPIFIPDLFLLGFSLLFFSLQSMINRIYHPKDQEVK